MAKLLKGGKTDKEAFSRNKNTFADSSGNLYGENFYNILNKISKNRKGPERKRKRKVLKLKGKGQTSRPFRIITRTRIKK